MPGGYDPLYFASAILPDGRMIVEGGEYPGGTARGRIGERSTTRSRTLGRRYPRQPGWTNVGDVQSDVLPNGTFMMAQACSTCNDESGCLRRQRRCSKLTNLTWTLNKAPARRTRR